VSRWLQSAAQSPLRKPQILQVEDYWLAIVALALCYAYFFFAYLTTMLADWII
jgi:hypothetical protein